MTTLGTKLDAYKGFGPGFDFLRIFFATAIVAWHCVYLAGSRQAMLDTPFWFAGYSLVPMFFTLSGFLVAGSSLRLDLKNFIVNRSLRIIPALVVDIILSALVVGVLFTTLPLNQYFSNHKFWSYFLNIFGYIHYLLPGVFNDNPITNRVNGSLWTVPYEIGCYILISILIGFGWVRSLRAVALCAAGLLLAAIIVDFVGLVDIVPHRAATALNFLFLDRGAVLIPAFLLGLLAYHLRYKIPYDWRIGVTFAGICLAVAVLGNNTWDRPLTHILLMPMLTYLVVYLGITPLPKLPFFSRGDYSYGIYLYHYPLAQALLAAFPGAWSIRLYHFLATYALVLIAAILSWHLVEKPILSMRKKFAFAEKMRRELEAAHDAKLASEAEKPTPHSVHVVH